MLILLNLLIDWLNGLWKVFLKVIFINNNNEYVLKFEGFVKIWYEIWWYVLNLISYINDRMVYVKG